MGLGKKQSSYSLKNISKSELGITKYEYAAEGYTLDEFYEKDPKNFFLYNLWDTALIVKLDEKTGIIDLENLQRRKMKVPLTSAMRGSSVLFDTFLYSKLTEENNYIRYGISSEKLFGISRKFIYDLNKNFNRPLQTENSKIKWDIEEISSREVSKILNRFAGAYVKDPVPGVYNGIICDLDASRLYPSVILQNNIGLNTFFGRIISPDVYNIFNPENKVYKLYKTQPESKFINTLGMTCLKLINNFVENISDESTDSNDEYIPTQDNKFKKKNGAKQQYYYCLMYLFLKILRSGMSLKQLMNPSNLNEYIITKVYFNNYIELCEILSKNEHEYNQIAYDYIINNQDINQKLFVVENYNNPNFRIVPLDGNHLGDYLKDNHLGMTLSGTLFKTHDVELSIFYNFLNELYTLRKQYKKEMYKYPTGSAEYTEFDRRQKTTKVIMNSTYGLLGMPAFRYSNRWLAKSITTSGRVALKTAQWFSEKYLDLLGEK